MREFLFLVLVVATGVVATIPTECPKSVHWNGPLMLADQSDCSTYYNCLMGEKLLVHCENDHSGQKLCFDAKSQSCKSWEKCGCKLDPECSSVNDDHVWAISNDNTGYYKCEKGKKVIRFCDSGKIFDQVKQNCQEKNSNAIVCPADSKETVRFWHPCLCNIYYECKNGEPAKQTCPSGELFDHKLLKCVSKDVADCNKPSEILPNGCPSNGISNIPHDTDCYRYYRCVNGEKTERHCEKGLAFDKHKGLCVWWSSAICDDKVTTVPPPTSCLRWSKPKRPDPNDCNRYYECVKGKIVPGKCLENHYFNEIVQACDLPQNTNCVPSGDNPDSDCPIIDCGKKRFPSEKGCEWYLECQNGKKKLQQCPKGLQYNKYSEMCDLPENVNCNEPPPSCKAGERKGHECQCNQYYRCNEDAEWALQQCSKGMEFDCPTKTCVSELWAQCCQKKSYWLN